MLNPTIVSFTERKVIGMKMTMSLQVNKTENLWKSFMVRRNEIDNKIGNDLYSVQYYDSFYFKSFKPSNDFEKWACIEVTDFSLIPSGMHSLVLCAGLYAVFLYKGSSDSGSEMFNYIFNKWLPDSIYELDNLAHFEILGEKYMKNDPNSEEDIYIPIKVKV
ncbi:MAG: GyrI-like domain-containing protein [Flavobacterium sp.]|nr:GyrI-like domain-containing protein [Pedobacter sp.]